MNSFTPGRWFINILFVASLLFVATAGIAQKKDKTHVDLPADLGKNDMVILVSIGPADILKEVKKELEKYYKGPYELTAEQPDSVYKKPPYKYIVYLADWAGSKPVIDKHGRIYYNPPYDVRLGLIEINGGKKYLQVSSTNWEKATVRFVQQMEEVRQRNEGH